MPAAGMWVNESVKMAENDHLSYQSPLARRNASAAMQAIFSPQAKFSTWRKLWVALARAQQALGLNITDAQIQQMQQVVDRIDLDRAAEHEKRLRHDVMAHVHTFAEDAPDAGPIIHLGATSCFVTDNADIILMRQAMTLLASKLAAVVDRLATFAAEHRDLPTLGLTHYQPAQPTTVGKRASTWAYDFVLALEEIEHRASNLKFRGVKGTTGTQASFLDLLGGDEMKVMELEQHVAANMGFDPLRVHPVTGQTYPRLVDAQVVSSLGIIAAAVSKMCNDIRLLAGRKELEEPFETSQIGSSAMAYKRNPMRCERATGLARFVMSLVSSPLITAATQWLERTLDDSANRRLAIAEAFLAIDGALDIAINVSSGLVVYPAMIRRNLDAELPFMATEAILMAGVAAGGDRQQLHEVIRTHSQQAAQRVKQQGEPNDLLERLADDPAFDGVDLQALADPKRFVGRAPQQVDQFIEKVVEPIRRRYRDKLDQSPQLKV